MTDILFFNIYIKSNIIFYLDKKIFYPYICLDHEEQPLKRTFIRLRLLNIKKDTILFGKILKVF